MSAQNVVLYALGARVAGKVKRRPLFSTSPGDPMLAPQINFHAGRAMNYNLQAGLTAPVLQCVLEERNANEGGQQTSAKFTLLDFATLKPAGKGASVSDLSALDPKE